MFTFSNYNKDNNIPSQYVANGIKTAEIVNAVFQQFPNKFRFTSGYRTPQKNAQVGGVTNSYHLTAQAADFVPFDGDYSNNTKQAIANLISKYNYEVIIHDAGSGLHYHIEPINVNSKTDISTETQDSDNTLLWLFLLGGVLLL